MPPRVKVIEPLPVNVDFILAGFANTVTSGLFVLVEPDNKTVSKATRRSQFDHFTFGVTLYRLFGKWDTVDWACILKKETGFGTNFLTLV